MTLEEPINSKIIDIVEEESRNSTNEANVDRWVTFFDSFQVVTPKTTSTGKKESIKKRPYLDQIKKLSAAKPYIYSATHVETQQENSDADVGRQIFIVDYQDLVHARSDMFGIYTSEKYKKQADKELRILNIKVLCYQIRNDWDSAKGAIKQAVWKLLNIHDKTYADILNDHEKLTIVVHNFEITKPVSDVSSKDLDKFGRLELLVAQFDDQPSIETLGQVYQCIKCNTLLPLPAGKRTPNKCINCEHAGTYVEERSMRKVRDFMYFIGQDTTDKMRVGQTVANSMNISVSEMPFVKSIYNIIEVGSIIAVNGVFRLAEAGTKTSLRSNAEFECVGIEVINEKSRYDKDIQSLVEREISPEQIDEHYTKLKKSYAPHLQGLDTAKEILLIHAASGNSLRDKKGGTRMRGRMNTLLFGDTGQGKSELFNFHMRLNNRSIPTTGSHISRVGLTASIKKIETVRGGEKIVRQSIDPGPYGTCRGGDVGIDEWDKVANKDIYEAVSSAMDNFQILHIDKNAAHATILCDCGSLHVANPTAFSGKYDTNISILKQTNFAHWLWSRYDFKVLFLSHKSDEARHMLWQHKAKTMENMITENAYNNLSYDQYIKNKLRENVDILEDDIYPFDYLVQELAYIREKYPDPVLKPNSMAWIMMMNFWNKFNKISIIPDTDMLEGGERSVFVPCLDERAQDSMIRAAKAVARLHRSNEVTTEHMTIVIKLMRESIRQFIPHVNLETEMEREDKAARDMLNETIKAAMLFTTKELNDRIVKFYYAFVKVLKSIHQQYFIKCDICNGKGYMSERIGYSSDSAEKNMVCTACRNTKGEYRKLSFNEFEKICIDTGTSIYSNDFFALMKRIKFIVKDEAVTTTVYYRVPRDIPSLISARMLQKVQMAINTQFGLDEVAILEQKKLLVNQQKTR